MCILGKNIWNKASSHLFEYAKGTGTTAFLSVEGLGDCLNERRKS